MWQREQDAPADETPRVVALFGPQPGVATLRRAVLAGGAIGHMITQGAATWNGVPTRGPEG